MIKKILISAGIIIVFAGVVVGVLYFIKQTHPVVGTKNSSSTPVLDHSKDYGACKLLTTSLIKTTLGSAATNLQTSENMGITKDRYVGDGVKDVVSDSQSCVYAFVSGGTLENGFNADNGLSVEKTVFTNKEGPKALIAQIIQLDPTTQISSLGDAAFYTADTASQGPGATDSFELQIFKGNDSTSYTIQQPAAKSTFTADTAKAALLALAQ
jgi:hypothetical protein